MSDQSVFGLVVVLVACVGLALTAIARMMNPQDWWSRDTFIARNDPLRWPVQNWVARGADPPGREDVIAWSVVQLAFATAIGIAGVWAFAL